MRSTRAVTDATVGEVARDVEDAARDADRDEQGRRIREEQGERREETQ